MLPPHLVLHNMHFFPHLFKFLFFSLGFFFSECLTDYFGVFFFLSQQR